MATSQITGLPPKSPTLVAPPIAIKNCVGIDVSKDHLEVCFSQMDIQQTVQIKSTRKFANRLGGWKSVDAWVKRLSKTNIPLWLVMEATGVYYEGAAYYLTSQHYQVAVVLPNKSKSFIQSLNLKTKTDAMEARALAQMGLERKMKAWRGFSKTMLTLKRLCRERETIQEHLVAASNQLHAHKYEHNAEKKTLQRAQQHIKFLQKQIQDIDRQIEQTLVQGPDLKAKIDKVCTLKGVSTLTAVTIISETNGFELIENKAQLVSYAGYDVVERQSGSSIKGKTRISKKGNAHIRRALHYPALSAARYDPNLHALYQRVVERNPKAKMVALVAVQRKLLVLIYTLFKNNMEYDPNYAKNKTPIPN
ncbi:MAG: IS110 family transposase [Saprospirales bacterium]|nr:IS110 family transposase [Saprospirales bacterium]